MDGSERLAPAVRRAPRESPTILDAPWRRSVLRLGIVASVIAALTADLPWGDFQNHTHWGKVGWIPFVSPPVHLLDIAENLLLFAPLAFFVGLESSLERGTSWTHAAWRAAFIAFCVSFLGEWSQLYSHTRFPSAKDLTCNVAGATCAAVIAVRGVGMWRVRV